MGCEAGAPQVVREGSHGVGWMFEGWRPRVCEVGFLQGDVTVAGGVPWGPVGCKGGAPRVQGWVRWCARVESHGE